MERFKQIISEASKELDLTNEDHLKNVCETADKILALDLSSVELTKFEDECAKEKDKYPLPFHLGIKLAKSKTLMSKIKDSVTVSVIFAVYGETNRIKTSDEHPHGENFLERKLSQLGWLFDSFSNLDWRLTIVDDGCPDGSGNVVKEKMKGHKLEDKVEVIFLKDGIDQKHPTTDGLTSTDDSRKGGSIAYGMWSAVQKQYDGKHIVLFTDADMSTHLGQVGLLVDEIVTGGYHSAIGSRRELSSVVVKQAKRNNRGKLFIYLWKRILHDLNYIFDTQCGFKAFTAEATKEIVEGMLEKQFAFDIELLLRTEVLKKNSIKKVGVAWIDSEAASTTTNISPYLSMLQSMVGMYKKYLKSNEEGDKFSEFIDNLSEESFNYLVENVPQGILDREPADYSEYNGVQVSEFENVLANRS